MAPLQFNAYNRQLSPADLKRREHRRLVGGMWDEIGELQFQFLRNQGLTPECKLLDVGCGCMRGGIHFARYLNVGHYYGLDINQSLIDAAKLELNEAGLTKKKANLAVNDQFEFSIFETQFDFAIAVSVFTHLPMNHIIRCLIHMRSALTADGQFCATYFEAPTSAYLEPLVHQIGFVTSHFDADPFHYSQEELSVMAETAGLDVSFVGHWNHPRDQRMAIFKRYPS